MFVCHALSGDAHAAGHHGDPQRRGWWDTLIGPGKPLDTERYFVICPNLLGGCAGSTGPASVDPRSGRAYGLRFPLFTVRDLITVHRALLERLGISRLHAAVGGSLGGMQALQWALDRPRELERAILVCASARLSAQNIALSAIARSAITEDPDFQRGDYLDGARRPSRGLALARKLGHVTYLSEESMRRKFDRARRAGAGAPMTMDDRLRGRALPRAPGRDLRRALRRAQLPLSRRESMDYFEPFADPRLELAPVETSFLAISFDSDWRFGSEHSRYIVERLQAGGVAARHVEVSSPWGHDSFLLDGEQYHRLVAEALE